MKRRKIRFNKAENRTIAAKSLIAGASVIEACAESRLSKPIVDDIARIIGLYIPRPVGRPRLHIPRPPKPRKIKIAPRPNVSLAGRNAIIAQRIENGELLSTIGRDLGLTRERIRQIAGKQGVESVRGLSHKRQEERRIRWAAQAAERKAHKEDRLARKDAAVDLVRNGMSITKAALQSGMSMMTLQKWCKKRRVESTKLTRWSSRLPAMKEKARNAILSGGTIKEAMDASGVSSMLATKIRGELVREGRIQPYRQGLH